MLALIVLSSITKKGEIVRKMAAPATPVIIGARHRCNAAIVARERSSTD